MIQRGCDLSLAPKALEDHVSIHPALDELDGHCLIELAVDPNGAIDDTHPAAPDFLFKAIYTYPAADHRIGRDVL
jgi:hypothetical protein